MNQAALKAALDEATCVSMEHLLNAADKVQFGPEKRSSSETQKSYRTTAFHESGHTIVAIYTKDATPVHKVTIIPRANSLGHVSYFHFYKANTLNSLYQLYNSVYVSDHEASRKERAFFKDQVANIS